MVALRLIESRWPFRFFVCPLSWQKGFVPTRALRISPWASCPWYSWAKMPIDHLPYSPKMRGRWRMTTRESSMNQRRHPLFRRPPPAPCIQRIFVRPHYGYHKIESTYPKLRSESSSSTIRRVLGDALVVNISCVSKGRECACTVRQWIRLWCRMCVVKTKDGWTHAFLLDCVWLFVTNSVEQGKWGSMYIWWCSIIVHCPRCLSMLCTTLHLSYLTSPYLTTSPYVRPFC